MPDEIKEGSVVQLKSGGPIMTVAWVERAGEQYTVDVACCTWFVQDKPPFKVDEKVFPLTTLKLLQT
jgi:uncharacterized protein YodC (DUF2158 family)